MYIGSWSIDDLLTFIVSTQVFSTGVATDADAVPAYRVYEDETTTPILTGTMALLDSANTAGLYSEQITLSAANGFEVGKAYSIYIGATVSGVAGATHRTFQVKASVLDAAGVRTAVGLASANLDTQIAAVQADTDNIQTRLPAALVSGRMDSSIGAVASGAIAAAAFAANALDAVWSTTARVLTAGTNIVLAKGTGVTGFNDLDAAGVRTATGLTLANLDTLLGDIPTADENADALLKRDWTALTGEASRSVLNALRFIRNRFSTTATPGKVTIYKEDDSTIAFEKDIVTDASAQPIVEG